MSGYWDFAKLKGSSNYSTWVTDAQSVLILHDVWSVVENDAMLVPATAIDAATSSTSMDKSAVSLQQAGVRKDCEKAWAVINLIVEPAVRERYKHIGNPFKVWKKLEELFAARETTARAQTLRGPMARDQTMIDLINLDSSKYNSLHEYTMELKRHQNRMIDLSAIVPDWVYLSYFRLGLEARYKAILSGFTTSRAITR